MLEKIKKSMNTSCVPLSSNENLKLLSTQFSHGAEAKQTFLINRPYYFSFKRRWTNSVSTQSNYNVMSVVYIYIATFHIRSRQGSYFQPSNQRSNNEVVSYQDRVHTNSCYPDGQ